MPSDSANASSGQEVDACDVNAVMDGGLHKKVAEIKVCGAYDREAAWAILQHLEEVPKLCTALHELEGAMLSF